MASRALKSRIGKEREVRTTVFSVHLALPSELVQCKGISWCGCVAVGCEVTDSLQMWEWGLKCRVQNLNGVSNKT